MFHCISIKMNLSKGWKAHAVIPGAWHLVYSDPLVGDISIVTGPRGSGLMGCIEPGYETTYEAWFPRMTNPMGNLTLDEIKGIIKYLRQREEEHQILADSVDLPENYG